MMDLTNIKDNKVIILETSIKLFAKKGVLQTSIQEIADACGIKQTALLYHFQTKFILIENVIKYIANKNRKIVEGMMKENLTGKEKIQAYWKGNIEWAASNRSEAGIILFLYYMASFEKEFSILYNQVKESAQSNIRQFLEEEARVNSHYRFSVLNIKTVAGLIHEIVIGGILHLITSENGPTEKEKKALIKKWLLSIEMLTK